MSIISNPSSDPNIENIVNLQIKFNYPSNIIFNLQKYDSNDEEYKEIHILSNNEKSLKDCIDFLLYEKRHWESINFRLQDFNGFRW